MEDRGTAQKCQKKPTKGIIPTTKLIVPSIMVARKMVSLSPSTNSQARDNTPNTVIFSKTIDGCAIWKGIMI